MADIAHLLEGVHARHLSTGDRLPADAPSGWDLDGLAGRLTEITAYRSPAVLSAAMFLVRDAQQRGEPAIWIASQESLFYPPDAAAMGVDLAALTVVQVPFAAMAKAADRVVRSGGFGLLVLDMVHQKGARHPVPYPRDGWISRLGGLAKRHDTAVLFLTHGDDGSLPLGALVSLRGEARRTRGDDDNFALDIRVVKDKRGTPGRRRREPCHGPAGLY